MGRLITLCRECRTIQKAETVCTICGAPVARPSNLNLPGADRAADREVEVLAQPVVVLRRA